jgi:hypothetical protein
MKPNQKAAVGAVQDNTTPASSLPELCTEAADHIASARGALHDESYDADQALADLDEAILCLKRLFARGTASKLQASNGNEPELSLRSA